MLRDFEIFIIGRFAIQNALLAAYLQGHDAATCKVFLDRGCVQEELKDRVPDRSILLLFDYRCLTQSEDASLFGDLFEGLPKGTICAVFNLPHSLDLEWELIRSGVRGAFYRRDKPDSLLKGIQSLFNDELWFPRRILSQIVVNNNAVRRNSSSSQALTCREKSILRELRHGASNQQIADCLCISPLTVKTHLYNIFRKIAVSNRHQAYQWSLRNLPQLAPHTEVVDGVDKL